MSDITALANKLAALIVEDHVFVDGARVISQGGAPPALPAILGEIDDTVLERTLVFAIDDVSVSMAVSGRRLRGFTEISGDLPEVAEVAGKVLSREDRDTLRAAGDLMTLLSASAARVTVRSLPAQPLGSSADAGISALGLAEIWRVDMDAVPEPPMVRFLAANAASMTAHLYLVDGSVFETSGNTAALQNIWEDQAAAFRKEHKALSARQDGPMLVCLENAIRGKSAAAIAIAGGEICLFTYQADQIGAILKSWYAVTA